MTPEVVMGIVLSSRNIGETDRRIVLLTRERGKISAFARGAVKPRNPLVSATQPFTFGEFFVYAGRDSYTVTGAEVKNYFNEFTKDLEKYYYASYLCEVADYNTRENLDAGEELLLLYQSLRALEKGTIGNELVRYIFEWRMLALNGEVPQMFECIDCRRKSYSAEDELSVILKGFSASHHGMLCEKCISKYKDTDIRNVSSSLLYTIQYILSSRLEKLYTFTVTTEVLGQLKNLTDEYLKLNGSHQFNTLEFINMTLGEII